MYQPSILYEDNHLLIVNKKAGEIVQGDKTGDASLLENLKSFIKVRDHKPGNVYLGLIHRLDRPTSGVVAFAKTSKALERMNKKFKSREVEKVYWALVKNPPSKSNDTLIHYLKKNPKLNKVTVYPNETEGSKKAVLHYTTLSKLNNYTLLGIELETGRSHQIRAQLSKIGSPIKGDLKYGAERSNKDGSISLHARELSFEHPVTKKPIKVIAPVPQKDALWTEAEKNATNS